VLKEAEEGVLCKLICQDGQGGQGGCREQFILVALHILKVNGDSCERAIDPVDSLDKIGMGRDTWDELLNLLSLMEGSQIVTSHYYQPRGDCMKNRGL